MRLFPICPDPVSFRPRRSQGLLPFTPGPFPGLTPCVFMLRNLGLNYFPVGLLPFPFNSPAVLGTADTPVFYSAGQHSSTDDFLSPHCPCCVPKDLVSCVLYCDCEPMRLLRGIPPCTRRFIYSSLNCPLLRISFPLSKIFAPLVP